MVGGVPRHEAVVHAEILGRELQAELLRLPQLAVELGDDGLLGGELHLAVPVQQKRPAVAAAPELLPRALPAQSGLKSSQRDVRCNSVELLKRQLTDLTVALSTMERTLPRLSLLPERRSLNTELGRAGEPVLGSRPAPASPATCGRKLDRVEGDTSRRHSWKSTNWEHSCKGNSHKNQNQSTVGIK